MKLACPLCSIELRVKKNSVGVEMMAEFGPYQYFHADLLHCPACGHEVIGDFGARPIVEHRDPRYEAVVRAESKFTPIYRVWANQQQKERYERYGVYGPEGVSA